MMADREPVGAGNDATIMRLSRSAGIVIAAWGTCGAHLERWQTARGMVNRLYHLGLTKGGQPKHPLYLRADTQPVLWNEVGG